MPLSVHAKHLLFSALIITLLSHSHAEVDCTPSPLSLAWRHNLPSGTASKPLITRDPVSGETRIIVTTTHGYITVLDESGHVMSGFPIQLSDRIYADPVLLDADGDSIDDIVVVDGDGTVFAIPMVSLTGSVRQWRWDGWRVPALEVDKEWYQRGFEVPVDVALGNDEIGSGGTKAGRKPIIGKAVGSEPLTRVGKKKVWDGNALLGEKLTGKKTKIIFGKKKNRRSSKTQLRSKKKKGNAWRSAVLSTRKRYVFGKRVGKQKKIRVIGLGQAGKEKKDTKSDVASRTTKTEAPRKTPSAKNTERRREKRYGSGLGSLKKRLKNDRSAVPRDGSAKVRGGSATTRRILSFDIDEVLALLEEDSEGVDRSAGSKTANEAGGAGDNNKSGGSKLNDADGGDVAESKKTVEIPAHVVTTPLVYDCDGDGILDLILPVSYHFDKHSRRPKDIDPNNYVSSGIIVYSPKKGIIWSKYAELTTAYSHPRAMLMTSPVVAALPIMEQGRSEANSGGAVYNKHYIVFSTSMGYTHAWELQSGKIIPSQFPIITNAVTTMDVVDIDGDSIPEIIIADIQGKISIYNSLGKIVMKIPTLIFRKRLGIPDTTSRARVLVHVTTGDVNGDGTIDLVAVARDGVIWAFDGADVKRLMGEEDMKENDKTRELMSSILQGFPHRLAADVKKGVVLANLDVKQTRGLLDLPSFGSSAADGKKDGKSPAPATDMYGMGLHIIGADENGRVFAVDGRNGCLDIVHIGEGVRGMVSLGQLGENKFVKIVAATEQGSIITISSSSLYSPSKSQKTRPEGQWTAYIVSNGEGRRSDSTVDVGGSGKKSVKGKELTVSVQINDVRHSTVKWLAENDDIIGNSEKTKISQANPKYYVELRLCTPASPASVHAAGNTRPASTIVNTDPASPMNASVRIVVQQPGRHDIKIAAPTLAWESALCLRVENEAGDVVTDAVPAVWNEDFYVMMKLMIIAPVFLLSSVLLYTRLYNQE